MGDKWWNDLAAEYGDERARQAIREVVAEDFGIQHFGDEAVARVIRKAIGDEYNVDRLDDPSGRMALREAIAEEYGVDNLAELIAPEIFLIRRLKLVNMRRAADSISVSDEWRNSLDELLDETEEAARTVLLETQLPSGSFIDEIFDDDLLTRCLELRIDLVAWISQPTILVRLSDPDAILRRYTNLANAYGVDTEDITSAVSFRDAASDMEQKLRDTYEILKKSGKI